MSAADYKITVIDLIINILLLLIFIGIAFIIFFTIQGDISLIAIASIFTNTITGILLSVVARLNSRLCKENYNLIVTVSELIKRKY